MKAIDHIITHVNCAFYLKSEHVLIELFFHKGVINVSYEINN